MPYSRRTESSQPVQSGLPSLLQTRSGEPVLHGTARTSVARPARGPLHTTADRAVFSGAAKPGPDATGLSSPETHDPRVGS